jgi:hypothetical protein
MRHPASELHPPSAGCGRRLTAWTTAHDWRSPGLAQIPPEPPDRRGRKLATADALIAATAAAHRLPLITRDHDFADIDGLDVVIV